MRRFTARVYEIEQGQNEVVLNEKDAMELTLEIGERVRLKSNGREITALVDHSRAFVKPGELLLFYEAAKNLQAQNGAWVELEPAPHPLSVGYIRRKIDGRTLTKEHLQAVIGDLMQEKLSNAELAAFMTAVHMRGLSPHETTALTEAIVKSGYQLDWKGKKDVASMHSIGGVAGDRTTMLVVPILASLGVTIPKTVTKAISSASGTADTMEVLAPVSLTTEQIERVVNQTGGCIAWGGAVDLAVADDKLIRIRHPLRLDPEPLVLASILAKKKAEGVHHVLIDVPFGRGAKVDNLDHAHTLAQSFKTIGKHLGLNVSCLISNGSNPLLDAVGPALEARAVLEALDDKGHGLLREKACLMAGTLLSMATGVTPEKGYAAARKSLSSGRALKKFREIIKAQGGDPKITPSQIPIGDVEERVKAQEDGTIAHVDNRNVAHIARSLGAPANKRAGVRLFVKRGDKVKKGQELFRLITTDKAHLHYALRQLKENPFIHMAELIIEQV
jgi:AMP phosphorylase